MNTSSLSFALVIVISTSPNEFGSHGPDRSGLNENPEKTVTSSVCIRRMYKS